VLIIRNTTPLTIDHNATARARNTYPLPLMISELSSLST